MGRARAATADQQLPQGGGTGRGLWLAGLAGVGIVTVVLFAPALDNGFVNWDDPRAVLDNASIRSLGPDNLRWMFTTFHMGPYQPLAWLSLAVDYQLWGGYDARGFHLTAVLLHAGAAMLLFVLAARLLELATGEPGAGASGVRPGQVVVAAAVSALLFAVHPLRVESVAWVTERRDVLSGVLFMATLVFYVAAVAPRRQVSPGMRRLLLATAIVLAALAMLAKAAATTLPLVLLVLDVYPLRRLAWRAQLRAQALAVVMEKLPFLALGVITGLVAVRGQAVAGAMHPLAAVDWPQRMAIMARGLAFYPVKTLAPSGLAPLYEIPHGGLPVDAALLGSALVVVALTAGAILGMRRAPAFAACWAAYLALIGPVSGVVQSGPQYAADRYSYLSCVPFAVLAGGLLVAGWRRWAQGAETMQRGALTAGAVVVLVALAVVTNAQIGIWHDSLTLWNATIERHPATSIAYSNRGQIWVARSDWARAEADLAKAVELFPSYSDAVHNLSFVLGMRGDWAGAERLARRALEIEPDSSLGYQHLGGALMRLGRLPEAVDAFERVVELEPANSEVRLKLASLYHASGRSDDAVAAARASLAQDPGSILAHLFLSGVLHASGRLDEAMASVRAALELDPRNVDAHTQAGEILLARGDSAAARAELEQALRLRPGHPRAQSLLESIP